jgi:hypothetical protein
MKQPMENSLPMAKAAKRLGFRSLLVLLVIALLGLAAQAETFSFKLVRAPIALNPLNPTSESIRMSGGGTFDPALGAVAASGTYTLFNAFDHPNGPTVNGTWHSTGFVSFDSLGTFDGKEGDGKGDDGEGDDGEENDGKEDGVLTISIATVDADGTQSTGQMTLTHNGIEGPIYFAEPYIVPPGGSGGHTIFQRKDQRPFYPPVP